MVSVVFSLLFSLLFLSAMEYVFHRWPMHNAPFVRRTGLGKGSFENHAVLHHGRFYKQFVNDPDPAAKHVGVSLEPGFLLLGLSPVWVTLYLISPTLGLTLAAALVLHGTVWTAVHAEMHDPKGRWWSRTPLYRFWRSYHKRHHENPGSNFNVLVPLFDFVFGTYGGLSR